MATSSRLVFVGGSPERALEIATALRVVDAVWVTELYALLIALDTEVRTCVIVDAADCPIAGTTLAALAPDFPGNVSTVVASMDTAIREAFRRLRPASDYDALYAAARCRSEADWIVGLAAAARPTGSWA